MALHPDGWTRRQTGPGGPTGGTISFMSRGPTLRVQRLLAAGNVSEKLLQAATHEADLLTYPYVGLEHLELGRLTLAGRFVERDALRRRTPAGVRRRWWRPRGRHSALRTAGLARTKQARLAAERVERGDIPGSR